MTPATPLSDAITVCSSDSAPEAYDRFLRLFLTSKLGVIVPELRGPPGVYRAGEGEFSVRIAEGPPGSRLVLACADRSVFITRFKRQFNAEMDAVNLMNVAMFHADCDGILVNSTASEHSLVIRRDRIPALLKQVAESANPRTPWWRRWLP